MTGRALAAHTVNWKTITFSLAFCGAVLWRFLARILPWKSRILFLAAREGRLNEVRLLLAAGADPHATNRRGVTILTTVVRRGHTEIVRLLLRAGADPNLRGWGESITPLAASIEEGRHDMVRALLEGGADLEGRNYNGTTISSFGALTWAAYQGRADMVELLLGAGAAPDREGGHPDTRTCGYAGGWRPLAVAAGEGHLEIVRMLLEAGAEANPENEKGLKALELATQGGHTDIAELIGQVESCGQAPISGVPLPGTVEQIDRYSSLTEA